MTGSVLLAVHPVVRGLVFDQTELSHAIQDQGIIEPVGDLGAGGWQSFDSTALSTAEVAITGWGSPAVDDHALGLMPNLRAVLHVGGSVREVTSPALWERGIAVSSAADVNNESVADFVAATVLLGAKGSLRASARMRATGRVSGPFGGPGVNGLRVGLVSYGSVARRVARRLTAQGAVVSAWDPFVSERAMAEDGVVFASELQDLFARSAVVSIHTPLIPGRTEGLIGNNELASLSPDAILINTSRGAVIDEAAMTDFLAGRPDVLAVLDVTVDEPPAATSTLYELPNVLLTGHSAGSVGADNRRMGDWTLAELERLRSGIPLAGLITKEAADLRA